MAGAAPADPSYPSSDLSSDPSSAAKSSAASGGAGSSALGYSSSGGELPSTGAAGPSGGSDDSEAPTEIRELRRLKSTKAATTSTLKYSGGTVTVPDCSALTLGASHLIFAAIAEDYDGGKLVADDSCYDLSQMKPTFLQFHERAFLTDRSFKREPVPTIETIYKFLDKVFSMAKYSAECIVLGQVLLNRFLGATGMPITGSTWRLMKLACIMLAQEPIRICYRTSLVITTQKTWDDRALANADFVTVYKTVCPEVSHITKVDLKAMNAMESTLLQWLQFSVNVKGSTYAMYFMEMQSFALESNPKASRSKALTKKEQDLIAARIGQADEALQDAATRAGEEARRSLTLEDVTFKRPAPIAIIS